MSDHETPLPEIDLSKPPAENMVRVTFEPENKTVEFPFDTLPYDGHGQPMSFLDLPHLLEEGCRRCLRSRRPRARSPRALPRPPAQLPPRLPVRHREARRLRRRDPRLEQKLRPGRQARRRQEVELFCPGTETAQLETELGCLSAALRGVMSALIPRVPRPKYLTHTLAAPQAAPTTPFESAA
jgi:hypothetical protein